jgi:hypothetical protein
VVDVFEEVEEQLRSDRYRTLAKKGWPYIVGLAVAALLIFGGVWGYRHYQATQSAKASQAYAAAFDLGAKGDMTGAEKAFVEMSKSGPRAYRALALMQVGGLRVSANKPAEAVPLFDQAAELAPSPLVADAARLKAAYILFETTPLPELRKRLDPLAEAGRPYAALAREAVAMKQLASGQTADARAAFSALALFSEATEAQQARAQAAVVLIDSGTIATANRAAAIAATLPPTPAFLAGAAANPESPPAGAAPQ